MGKKVPVALLDGSCVWVPEKDAAALAGLSSLPKDGKEYAGAIYQNEKGEFCYSVGTPGTKDNFAFSLDPAGGKFAGIFHNHPGGGEHDAMFSTADVDTANTLKKDSYIRADSTGDTRVYRPGVTPTDSIPQPGSRSQRMLVSKGEPVKRRDQIVAAMALEDAKLQPEGGK